MSPRTPQLLPTVVCWSPCCWVVVATGGLPRAGQPPMLAQAPVHVCSQCEVPRRRRPILEPVPCLLEEKSVPPGVSVSQKASRPAKQPQTACLMCRSPMPISVRHHELVLCHS